MPEHNVKARSPLKRIAEAAKTRRWSKRAAKAEVDLMEARQRAPLSPKERRKRVKDRAFVIEQGAKREKSILLLKDLDRPRLGEARLLSGSEYCRFAYQRHVYLRRLHDDLTELAKKATPTFKRFYAEFPELDHKQLGIWDLLRHSLHIGYYQIDGVNEELKRARGELEKKPQGATFTIRYTPYKGDEFEHQLHLSRRELATLEGYARTLRKQEILEIHNAMDEETFKEIRAIK